MQMSVRLGTAWLPTRFAPSSCITRRLCRRKHQQDPDAATPAVYLFLSPAALAKLAALGSPIPTRCPGCDESPPSQLNDPPGRSAKVLSVPPRRSRGIPVSFRALLRPFSSKLKKPLAPLLHRPGEPPSPEFAPRWHAEETALPQTTRSPSSLFFRSSKIRVDNSGLLPLWHISHSG